MGKVGGQRGVGGVGGHDVTLITVFSSKLPIKVSLMKNGLCLFVILHFHTGFKPQTTVTEKKKEIKKEIKNLRSFSAPETRYFGHT